MVSGQLVTENAQLKKVVVKSIKDPWYGNQEGFDECYQAIANYCDILIDEIRALKP